MKKIISILAAAFIMAASVYGNFFDHRFFEIKVDVPAQLSNNMIGIKDFFCGDVFEIDFREIADDLPKSGFQLGLNAQPEVQINFDTKKFGLSLVSGFDMKGKFTIGKGLFDFLGYGNELYKDIEVDANVNADVFAYAKVPVKFGNGKFTLKFAPAMFFPMVHMNADGSKIIISNDEDGNFMFNVDGKANVYSIFDPSSIINGGEVSYSQYISEAFKNRNYGFDMEGSVGYSFTKALKLTTSYRIPILPGQMNYVTPYSYAIDFETNLTKLTSGEPMEFNTVKDFSGTEACDYVINRPLKLNATADFDPFRNNNFVMTGMLGFGVNHPFSSIKNEADFYLEYFAGVKASLAGILGVSVSTSYQEQLFIHRANLLFNIRLIEIDVGVASQSTSFASSFRGDGLGAYVTAAIGF